MRGKIGGKPPRGVPKKPKPHLNPAKPHGKEKRFPKVTAGKGATPLTHAGAQGGLRRHTKTPQGKGDFNPRGGPIRKKLPRKEGNQPHLGRRLRDLKKLKGKPREKRG